QGRLVIRSRVSSADLMRTKLPDATIRALFDAEGQTVVYKRADGREVVGVLRRVPRLRWAAVAELPRAEAFRRGGQLRSLTALMIAAQLAGDAALAKIADILRKTTRAVDCVARYGGEEFLVVLLETTTATATLVAERIRARVAAEPFDGGRITVSIGVAECPAHGDTPE